jgi:hypothetical protein
VTVVANTARGEVPFRIHGQVLVVRPSFAALVAAESEIGPLLALAGRAGQGNIRLAEIEALIWHCLVDRSAELDRSHLGEALLEQGLANAAPMLRTVLRQILAGGG